MWSALELIYNPNSADKVSIFYLFWISVYVLIHVVWDIRSKYTRAFHISKLASKTSAAYNAATFASSLLILLSFIQPPLRPIVGDIVTPLILAGLSGVLQSVGALCPYDAKDRDAYDERMKQAADTV